MEAIGELSSGIVHDFNNILHPIIGSLEILLEDTANNRKLQKTVKNILNGANMASNLVEQILSISHKTDFNVKPVKIQPIIREVLKLNRSTIPPDIKIIQTIDNECDPVLVNPTHIHQIVMNLITNAVHAMGQDGGILDVTLKQFEVSVDEPSKLMLNPGSYACLGIADTGGGIDSSIKNMIFEPLFTTKKTGTGLGLSVISSIVKKYDGNINFFSMPGQGSLFQVFIPSSPTPFHADPFVRGKQKPLHGCESILFVDDDPFIVDVQKEILKTNGYSVTSFINSIGAFNKFKVNPNAFDLIVCDMTMPNLTGLALAVKIKKIRQNIPIIICTGFSEQINEKNYKNMDIDGFLMKPVKKEKFLKLIRHLLDNQ
ncbi:MAG: response regulator [Desulfobacteraceae bacterium]|nr:response regulator [Desulfobacteraceae bacterium]